MATAARRAAPRRGKKLISVDFTGVEAGGGRLLPEDRYLFEVDNVEEKEGEESGKAYLELTLKVIENPDYDGTKAWDNLSLQPQALWKLRGFMEAAGLETTDGPMDIDPDSFIGCIVECDVIHEDYKGKTKHRISSYNVPEDTGGGAQSTNGDRQAEERPAPSRRPVNGARRAAAEPEASWKVRQRVAFMDGKKRLEGVITTIEDDKITVRVGREEYEVGSDDLEAA